MSTSCKTPQQVCMESGHYHHQGSYQHPFYSKRRTYPTAMGYVEDCVTFWQQSWVLGTPRVRISWPTDLEESNLEEGCPWSRLLTHLLSVNGISSNHLYHQRLYTLQSTMVNGIACRPFKTAFNWGTTRQKDGHKPIWQIPICQPRTSKQRLKIALWGQMSLLKNKAVQNVNIKNHSIIVLVLSL